MNVLTSSSSAENKSGKEQLERGNLLCEKQMHMGVRDEQVIKGLLPLMHPAPGKQADMKWERSCFLPRQNKCLTAWAASMQHCWVCHGLSHYQTPSQLSTTGYRWKHWVLGVSSFFSRYILLWKVCNKTCINKAGKRYRCLMEHLNKEITGVITPASVILHTQSFLFSS